MSKRVIQANKKMSLIKVFDMVLINSNTKNLNLFRIIWRINVSLYNAYMATINTKLLVKYCGFTFFSFFFLLVLSGSCSMTQAWVSYMTLKL